MRQSEGNRTEKRLSAARVAQIRPMGGLRETILGPATAVLPWLARVRSSSSLLLKTASSRSRWQRTPAGQIRLLSQYNGDPCR